MKRPDEHGSLFGVHDGVSLTVELTPDELERLEFRADERGIDFHSLFEPADLKRPRLNGCLLTLVSYRHSSQWELRHGESGSC